VPLLIVPGNALLLLQRCRGPVVDLGAGQHGARQDVDARSSVG
jgi:hypothetical protein